MCGVIVVLMLMVVVTRHYAPHSDGVARVTSTLRSSRLYAGIAGVWYKRQIVVYGVVFCPKHFLQLSFPNHVPKVIRLHSLIGWNSPQCFLLLSGTCPAGADAVAGFQTEV